MVKVYRIINVLSFDVAFGAMILSYSLGRAMDVDVPWVASVCLGLSVWSVYTFDHLIDAMRIVHKPSTLRHGYHQRNFRVLFVSLCVFVVLGAVLSMRLPQITFIYGVGLVGIVGIYFVIVYFYHRFYLKEILVAIVYSTGVFLGPVSLSSMKLPVLGWSLYVQLLLIAVMNLTLFSLLEYESDKEDGHNSLALRFGRKNTERSIRWIYGVLLVTQIASLMWFCQSLEDLMFQLSFVVMGLVLMFILIKRESFRSNSMYRLLGDAIFFLPGLYFFADVIV